MNKIIVLNDIIEKLEIDDSIEISLLEKNELFDVNSIKIKVAKDTYLEIDYLAEKETKLDIFINVLEGVNFQVFEKRNGQKSKIQYKYYLEENSSTFITKFYDCTSVRELDIVNLNGIGASIDYHLKTISTNEEKYDMMVYHNYSKTISNIYNHGVNIEEGSLIFNITNIVLNNKVDCVINQNSRIITLNDNKCLINPNLLIDENDVEANHSALIGKFSDEEMFYLQSRGITKDQAFNLLIKGFLLSNLNINDHNKEELNKIINKYWR